MSGAQYQRTASRVAPYYLFSCYVLGGTQGFFAVLCFPAEGIFSSRIRRAHVSNKGKTNLGVILDASPREVDL